MAILVQALYTRNSGDPATGLALADIDIYLYRRTQSDGTVATVWNGINPTEEVGGGVYTRRYTGDDTDTYDYFAYAHYTGAVVLDSDYSLQDEGFALSNWAEALWDHDERTLTQSAAQVITTVSGSTVSVYRGTRWDITLTGLSGPLDTAKNIIVTVKREYKDPDSEAIMQLTSDTGLEIWNGSTSDIVAADGLITVLTATSIRIHVRGSRTDDCPVESFVYDVKRIDPAGHPYLVQAPATFRVIEDITRAIA